MVIGGVYCSVREGIRLMSVCKQPWQQQAAMCKQPWQQATQLSQWTSYNMVSSCDLIGCINDGCDISPQGYNVAPSTLAYFPASMETNVTVSCCIVFTLMCIKFEGC